MSKYFTAKDLTDIYNAAWAIGAPNARALKNSLPEYLEKAQNEITDGINLSASEAADHVVIRLFQGHINFLDGISLGPEAEDATQVEAMLTAAIGIEERATKDGITYDEACRQGAAALAKLLAETGLS